MVSKEDLKQMYVLHGLSEEMFEALMPHVELLRYNEGDIICEEGKAAEKFYMLKRGKIVLEKRASDKMTIRVGGVKPGYAFGWSVMLENGHYTLNTLCTETCEVLMISRDSLQQLAASDPKLGNVFTKNLLRIIKNRLDHRTEQLLRVIKNHPDMQALV
jgi:CRP-like cAMP-binding protein